MNRLLKYLFSLILIVAVFSATIKEESLPEDASISNSQVEEVSDFTTLSSPDQLFCTSFPVSYSGPARLQSGVKRQNHNVHKHNYTYLNSVKIIKSGIKYYIQDSSIIIHSALTEPVHRLILLCKLII